jgi:4-amino-4-deoxy-L-arabinose transferase-like glycosyltransferase
MVWLIWMFAGTFLLGAIRAFPPYAPDLLPVLPAIAVLAAIGLVGMVDIVQHYSQSLPVWLSIGALAVSAGVVCVFGLQVYFVEMPNRYKPNLEMSMFWSAFDLPRGSTIIFVRDEAYAPDFQPWGLQNFNTGVNWLMVEPAALDETDLQAECAIDCRVFYTPPYEDAVVGVVREQVGEGSVTQYTNEADDMIGYAFSPALQH